MTPKSLLPVLALALAAMPSTARPAGAAASAWADNPQSHVRLITPWRTAPQNGELRLGLHFKLAPRWHVYWKNSGDAGFPPVVVFAPASGLGKPELLWPAPHRFDLPGGLVAYGYADEVVYPLRATLQGAAGDRLHLLHLAADVDYLVCEVDCVPYRYTLTLDQPLGASPVPDPDTAPLLAAWWDRLPAPAESLAGVATDGTLDDGRGAGGPALTVRLRGARPAAGAQPDLFLETHDAFDTGRPAAQPTADGVVFRVPLKPREAGKALPRATVFAWTATGLEHAGRPVAVAARRTVALRGGPGGEKPPRALRLDDPALAAAAAALAVLAALALWGLGRPEPSDGHRASPAREALGFAAAALAVGALYRLSLSVSSLGLAAVELALLGTALCAWLRPRARRSLSLLLFLGLVACALAAPWLAHHHRLPPATGTSTPAAAA